MDERSVEISPPEIAEDHLAYFRFGRLAGKVLLTNDAGDWAFLTDSEFADLLAGRVTSGHARFAEMQRKGFVRDGLDLDALVTRMARRNRHVSRGPHLHVISLGRDPQTPMSRETATATLELALQSGSAALTFDFEAADGEPLHHFELLSYFVETARTRNRQTEGKTLTFRVVSNLSGMTEEIAEWLIANDVRLVTRLDGPAALHDRNVGWSGGSPHQRVSDWISYFHRRYQELKRDAQVWHVEAMATVTRASLGSAQAIVDEYVRLSLREIRFRPLSARRFAAVWSEAGLTQPEYLDFYRRALEHLLSLNRNGAAIRDDLTAIIATKIFSVDDVGAVDVQSPHGAGTGELAYDSNGRVYPSALAQRLGQQGDPMFELGAVEELSIAGILRHPSVRAIAAASLLEVQPGCAEAWNKPYCGISPVANYATQGDLFGQRHRCFEYEQHLAAATRLFEWLADESDAGTAEIMQRWVIRGAELNVSRRSSNEAP